jgi:hypothetical protein
MSLGFGCQGRRWLLVAAKNSLINGSKTSDFLSYNLHQPFGAPAAESIQLFTHIFDRQLGIVSQFDV